MIGRVSGAVVGVRRDAILVDVEGVGYLVSTTHHVRAAYRAGQNITLLTHHVTREETDDLYGFISEEDLSFFELLLTVSGVGPKTALAVMNLADVNNLKRAIASGEAAYLRKVSGIGRKTAERLVLELKDKLSDEAGGAPLGEDIDVLEALRSLGYPDREARGALKQLPQKLAGTSEKLREALKILTTRS